MYRNGIKRVLKFYLSFQFFHTTYLAQWPWKLGIAKLVRKQKSSCWKTIVSVHVYRNKPIRYILLIWVFHKHVVRYIIINKFGWSESKFKTRKKFKIIYGFIRKVHKHIDMHVTARPSLYLIILDQQFIESFIKIIPPIHFWTTSLGLNFPK